MALGALNSNEASSFTGADEATGNNAVMGDGRRVELKSLGPYPLDVKFELRLSMEDHFSPVLTTDMMPPPDPNGVRTVEIKPQAGCSAAISVYSSVDEKVQSPLGDIVLLFDGKRTDPSATDASIDAYFRFEPIRIEVLTPGWKLLDRKSYMDWGSVLVEANAFTLENGRLTIFLEAL
ncbi:MAG: hypothetical protein ACI8QS_002412 [Planctomycetota bacterium]